ncbi:hypothetical protein AADZ90_021870 [Aestuariibius sp. 2305UL40-4]|uniref:hypothetical protein n=1 Tax=Aestuariibius violaceus TaxID=3234132 RepID=UPI00398F55AF
MIRGGRKVLYMYAVSATSRDGPLGRHDRKIIRLGKHPKVALMALMRKLAILANTLITKTRH